MFDEYGGNCLHNIGDIMRLCHGTRDIQIFVGHIEKIVRKYCANLPIHFDGLKRSPRLAGYQ